MPESRENSRLRLKRLRAQNPEANRLKNHAYRQANPGKAWAHKQVEMAINRGALQRQPCERCQRDDLVHAHHEDYAKPLEVMWLCPLHHRERHREVDIVRNEESLKSIRKSSIREDRCIYQCHHRFRVAFDIRGKSIGFGTFDNLEDARKARDAALPTVSILRKQDEGALERASISSVGRPASSISSLAPSTSGMMERKQ